LVVQIINEYKIRLILNKTTFKILKMDCSSEEQMIRMKLDDLKNINSLRFDISNHLLTVFHTGGYEEIFNRIDSLKFNASFIATVEVDSSIDIESINQQRNLLWQVLVINFFFFVLEILSGFIANSMGLVADSLDMLADSLVYGLALFAVGGSVIMKKNIAKASGYFQLALAILGLIEVFRRFIGREPIPAFGIMVIVSILALMGNAICLYLLQKSKSKEVHMQASMIFTSNDVIVNIGVIVAGGLVFLTHSKYPDLVVGFIVFLLVGYGAIRILRLSQ
jgi:Co/Zn/Cd efflux system component